MKPYFRAIPHRVEFAIVILIAFGYFIYGSILTIFTPQHGGAQISNTGLQFLLVYELAALAALGAFLLMRGWSLQRLGFVPTIRDTVTGIGLALTGYFAYIAIWIVFSGFTPELGAEGDNFIAPGLNLTNVIFISVLNPVFEELFVCGYIIAALRKRRSIYFAINTSVAIRLAYHLYQGTVGVISIIPIGLIFAYWFARTGRLWPVVVAHAVMDFLSLMAYVKL
jgi:membrane protease YdiL (CAAX protease family)